MSVHFTVQHFRENHAPEINDIGLILLLSDLKSGQEFAAALDRFTAYQHFPQVAVVEKRSLPPSIDSIRNTYPWVTLVIFEDSVPEGTKVTIAADILNSDYFLVLTEEMDILSGFDPYLVSWMAETNALCGVPLMSVHGEPVPSCYAPSLHEQEFSIVPLGMGKEREKSLIPSPGYCGIYKRGEFLRLGGFSERYTSSFWQCADLGLRSWLSGSEILICSSLHINHNGKPAPVDMSKNDDFSLCMERNGGFSFNIDRGTLKISRKSLAGKVIRNDRHREIREIQHSAVTDLKRLCFSWMEGAGR